MYCNSGTTKWYSLRWLGRGLRHEITYIFPIGIKKAKEQSENLSQI